MRHEVAAVHRKPTHSFSKTTVASIELVPGHGVRDDAHYGVKVKHRSRIARDPSQPNLRQVHLLHEELFSEILDAGLRVLPGQMGENITTRGLDLLSLSAGTRLRLGTRAVVELTGLRNPCAQIERFMAGLLRQVLTRTEAGEIVRKAGVMCVVEHGGVVRPQDQIVVVAKPEDHAALQPV